MVAFHPWPWHSLHLVYRSALHTHCCSSFLTSTVHVDKPNVYMWIHHSITPVTGSFQQEADGSAEGLMQRSRLCWSFNYFLKISDTVQLLWRPLFRTCSQHCTFHQWSSQYLNWGKRQRSFKNSIHVFKMYYLQGENADKKHSFSQTHDGRLLILVLPVFVIRVLVLIIMILLCVSNVSNPSLLIRCDSGDCGRGPCSGGRRFHQNRHHVRGSARTRAGRSARTQPGSDTWARLWSQPAQVLRSLPLQGLQFNFSHLLSLIVINMIMIKLLSYKIVERKHFKWSRNQLLLGHPEFGAHFRSFVHMCSVY